MKRFQFVNWFPEWRGVHFRKLDKRRTDMAYIYDWVFNFMFWEIRKWHKLKPGEIEEDNKKRAEMELV